MLMGSSALSDPASPAYLPDDMQFYGQGPEATYALAAYFGESAGAVSAKVREDFNAIPWCSSRIAGRLVGRGSRTISSFML